MTEQQQPAASGPTAPQPHPRLRELEVLVGTWDLTGHDLDGGSAFTGTVTRRWLPGGYFLVQEMRIDDEDSAGAEYIGYDYAQDSLRSMFFSTEGPGPFCSSRSSTCGRSTMTPSPSGTASGTLRHASPVTSTAAPASSTGSGSGPAAATTRPRRADPSAAEPA
jgi:hypothetical protein